MNVLHAQTCRCITNTSHSRKRKIIFKSAFKRGYVSSLEGMSVCDNPKHIVNQGKFPPQKRNPSSDLVFWDRPSCGLLWSRSIPNSISKANHHKFNTKRKRENPLFKTSPEIDLSKYQKRLWRVPKLFQWQYHHVSTFQGLLDFQSKSKLTFKKRTIFESVPKAVGFLSLVRIWDGTETIMSTKTGKAVLQPQHLPPLYLPISLVLQSSYLLLFLLSPCLYNRFLVHMY